MTQDEHNKDRAILRAVAPLAAHYRYRDEYARAYRTVKRFPLFTLYGAARMHILNGDIFDGSGGTAEEAHEARRMQEAGEL